MMFNTVKLLSITFLFIAPCQAFTKIEPSNISWPQRNWIVSTPEKEGIAKEAIATITKGIISGDYGSIDHFLIIRHGRLIADLKYKVDYDEAYRQANKGKAINNEIDKASKAKTIPEQYNYNDTLWHPFFKGSKLHTLQSVTKSITSAAFGIAVDQGFIKSLDQPIYPYFKNYQYDKTDPRKAQITIEDVLTMRTGIDWYTEGGYENDKHSTIIMENSNNWLQYILDRPMDRKPGTNYEYNDGASVLLGKILRQATGTRADIWAEKNLFAPIGIKNFKWKITPQGEADTEGGLYLSTYDLARIGYLFLRKGQWQGKQIISEQWIEKSITPLVKDIVPDNNKANPGYGYQWYISQKSGSLIYLAAGYGGQYIIVAPESDVLVVVNGWSLYKKSKKSFLKAVSSIIASIENK